MPCVIQSRRLAVAALMILCASMLAAATGAGEAAVPDTRARIQATPFRQPAVRVDPALTPGTPKSDSGRLEAVAGAPVYLVPDERIVATRDHTRSSTPFPVPAPDGPWIAPRK